MPPRRFDRHRRLSRMAAINPRVPREPGRAVDPERRLRGLVDLPEDAPSDSDSAIGRLGRRLGPKGRFLATATLIGLAMTAAWVYWERRGNETATAADHGNPAQVALGHSLYDQHCAFCHGTALDGRDGWDGDYPTGGRPALPLGDSGAVWRLADRDLFDVTKFGGQPFSPPSYRNDMPGFEGRLADADIWAILAYVKSTWSEETRQRQKEAAKER